MSTPVYDKYFGNQNVTDQARRFTSEADVMAYVCSMIKTRHQDDRSREDLIAAVLWGEIRAERDRQGLTT